MTLTTGIERLRIRNYRVLRDVELDGLTPVTALLGPNGSGKSTVFDALDFLSESLRIGLRSAWDRRGGAADIATHGEAGPIEIEVTCRVEGAAAVYRLVIEHDDDVPVVAEERLTWQPEGASTPFDALHFRRGEGGVARAGAWEVIELAGPDLLGVGVVSQLAANAEIGGFHRFAAGIRLSDLDLTAMRKGVKTSSSSKLEPSGRNIGAVVEYLRAERPDRWSEIRRSLRRYIPGFEDIEPLRQGDGSWIVRLREQDGEGFVPPENISDGTLHLLGYLVALRTDTSVLLLEEPENQVHPRLHYLLAEDAREAESDQVIVATHAPRFVDAMQPAEVWAFARDAEGHSAAKRVSDEAPVVRMVESGGALGDLWTEGFFRFGDPLGERP
ncbi:AAA family ATPase [Amycolatopsis sp. NPDC026612]|uniref:AAA family ATPase n=1 Tax=Amycolatopsis sp. NPDC026612 TaxID=3155466 RepID=UPI0033D62396